LLAALALSASRAIGAAILEDLVITHAGGRPGSFGMVSALLGHDLGVGHVAHGAGGGKLVSVVMSARDVAVQIRYDLLVKMLDG
jgi:hypothetical protein